jgi:DNA polymerase-3 subunit delta
MQLTTARLIEQLSQDLRQLYTLHGDEALLLQEAADAIRASARSQGFLERHVFTVAGAHFDWSEIESACAAMSLFADKQLIDIRIPSGKPGKDGSEALQRIAQTCVGNDGVLVLVSLPRLDKTTKSSGWFTALDTHGISLQIDPVERAALPAWIAQRLALQQQRVLAGEEGQRSLQFFADRVEGNLLAAHQEIQKLALLYPTQELSFEQIENAC